MMNGERPLGKVIEINNMFDNLELEVSKCYQNKKADLYSVLGIIKDLKKFVFDLPCSDSKTSQNKLIEVLRKKHPRLTTQNIELCLKIYNELSTVQISEEMGISVNSVYVAKKRLRKKLNLNSSSIQLSSYFHKIMNEDESCDPNTD